MYANSIFDTGIRFSAMGSASAQTAMKRTSARAYDGLTVYYGDLHNHCGLSYGHGSLSDALHNARLQLDFASVTVHAHWPDLPTSDPALGYLVDYHTEGFRKAIDAWPHYLKTIERANQEGVFVTFPSYEWHSMQYGDYCVYYQNGQGGAEARPILQAIDLEDLREAVKQLRAPTFIIPHHIGYQRGYRGINWSAFSEELSPVAEIFSFHGLSETSEGPYPYLHSMGPRDLRSTAHHGWEQGHVFGVVGSTDHHNAFPGSYGYGRMGVWAESLSRDAIWAAISQRRTYALTGDRIDLAFSVNDQPMGAILEHTDNRWIEVAIISTDTIDCVDVLHNNRTIHRESPCQQPADSSVFWVGAEVGWGERADQTIWDMTLEVSGGRLLGIQPRFRGYGPTDDPPDDANFAGIGWEEIVEGRRIRFFAITQQNPSLHTAATEGLVMQIEGDSQTRLIVSGNGLELVQPLAELRGGARSYYLGGFVSPALSLHRAVPETETTHRFAFLHHRRSHRRDWYTVRVRQRNDQWAWSSPIWVGEANE